MPFHHIPLSSSTGNVLSTTANQCCLKTLSAKPIDRMWGSGIIEFSSTSFKESRAKGAKGVGKLFFLGGQC